MQRIQLIGTRDWAEVHTPLTRAGYAVSPTPPDENLLPEAFHAFAPDALILEMADDIFVLQHVRRVLRAELNEHPIPLLALVRRSNLHPPHFVVGVDDFLLPPYNAEELLARVQMLLWRFHHVNALNRIQCEGLIVDLARRTVVADGVTLSLTLREFQVLQFLMTHRGRTFTRESLLLQVWGYDFEGDVRVVDAYVKRVRSKLPCPYAERIETVRGVGYRFAETSDL